MIRKKFAFLAAVMLASCSAGGTLPSPSGGSHAISTSPAARHKKGKLVLRIHVPKRKHRKRVLVTHDGHPRYISPSTSRLVGEGQQ